MTILAATSSLTKIFIMPFIQYLQYLIDISDINIYTLNNRKNHFSNTNML